MGKHFKNSSELEFKDISHEAARIYVYPGGDLIEIIEPRKLHVSASGGHRIFDAAGNSWYIPGNYIAIRWNVKQGEDHFKF
jgi:hypothetical protein